MRTALLALSVAALTTADAVKPRALSFSVTPLGNYTLNPDPASAVRDLGFVGRIGQCIINTFGDTLTNGGNTFVSANSAGIGYDASTYYDSPNQDYPQQFCNFFSDEDGSTYGMGITTVIPTGDTTGVLYFLAIRRNIANALPVGAGVALITVDTNTNTPTCWRLAHYWWDGVYEPWYGDQSSFLSSDGQYVHAVGGCYQPNCGNSYIFASRVPVANATSLAAHEYWNGAEWTPNRFNASVTQALVDVNGDAITDHGQGQIVFNNHVGQYLYFDKVGLSNFRVRMSANPQGPWSEPQDIFAENINGCTGLGYTPTYDDNWHFGDDQVIIRYTCEPNILQAVQLNFN